MGQEDAAANLTLLQAAVNLVAHNRETAMPIRMNTRGGGDTILWIFKKIFIL